MSEKETLNLIQTKQLMQIAETLINAGYLVPPEYDSTINEKEDVRSQLKTDEKGRVYQSNENCQLILRIDTLFKNAIRFNELSSMIDICKDLGWKRESPNFCDTDLDNIITYMETHYGISAEKKIERAVRIIAKENSYHPLRDKLLNLKWDGISRISNALHHFLGADKSILVAESLKVFMLGAVSRIFNPGCKFELMLCLVGGQGAGKSTFLRFLAMNDLYFTDDIKKLDDKVFEHIRGHWIIEIPEMIAILNAKMVEETKSFVSRQYDNYRTPFDKYAVDHPRQCVFAGTSNKTQFLPMDKSGNRRFLPIEVNSDNAECHILDDEEASRSYIEQLWAEIMTIYLSGKYSLTLTKELQKDLLSAQEKHCPEDPMETAIRNYLDEFHPEYVCVKMLYQNAFNHSEEDTPAQWESNAISEIMEQKMTDYRKISTHRFQKYGTQRAWVLVKGSEFRELTDDDKENCPF